MFKVGPFSMQMPADHYISYVNYSVAIKQEKSYSQSSLLLNSCKFMD